MSHPSLLADAWKGFRIQRIETPTESTLQVILEPDPQVLPRCRCCGEPCALTHDRHWRRVRDRDLLDRHLTLELPIRRVECLACGHKGVERLEWLSPHQRITRRLAAWVEALAQLLPIRHVCQLTGLHWHTVKSIDKRRLADRHGGFDASGVTRLVMDEFALHKGHRYATVVMDAESQRVLWVGEGNSRAAIRPFFEQLGGQCRHIEAVAMDMNTAFDLEVRQHCPRAEVVYDLFHVVARFGRDVVDRVRIDQANALRHDRPARRVIKRSRWLLLRHRDNLSTDQEARLEELLGANRPLATVYLLKTLLREIWYAPSVWEGYRRWRYWYRLCQESDLPAAVRFAKRLKAYLRGILASAKYRLHTSVLEGVNNKIKVIKRMAYGFRDTEYFFLKIKDAFPGKAR